MNSTRSSTGPFGWEFLRCPANCKFDIVFIHGLTGGRRSTFTHDNGRFWPQDFLFEDLPDARIMTYGYDANVVSFKLTAGQNSLEGNALMLLDALVAERTDATRPLVFVTHNLGGLLCKQALLMAHNRPLFSSIFDACAGIMFIGTPHKGSKQARLGSLLAGLINIVRPTNTELIRLLKPGSEPLARLDDEFWTLKDGRKKDCAVHCYSESAPVEGLGFIVDRNSAARPGGASSPLDGTHRTMLKFATNRDAGYLSISSKLKAWANSLPSLALAEPDTALETSSSPGNIEARVDTPLARDERGSHSSPASAGMESRMPLPQSNTATSASPPDAKIDGKNSPSNGFYSCTFQDKVFPGMQISGEYSTQNFN